MSQYSDEVKNCQIAETLDIAKGLKNCKRNFAECRQYEDDAIHIMHLCSKSEDQLFFTIDILLKIKTALINIKAKITKVFLDNAETNVRAPATDCAGIVALILKGNSHLVLS